MIVSSRAPWLTAITLSLAVMAACDDGTAADPKPLDPTLVSIGLQSNDSLSVELLADTAPHVGLNRVYYRVKHLPDGKLVTAATLVQTPLMHMQAMDMEHGCPVEQPPASAEDGLFQGLIVFQMASGAPGSDTWRVELDVDLGSGGEPEHLVFADVSVAAADTRRDLSVTDAMGATSAAIVTLNLDAAPHVGQNTFTVTMHHKADMHGMMWAADDDCTMTITPNMPSMGHGSTQNIDPVHVGGGRYEGSVNFTMPGLWNVTLAVARAGIEVGTVQYSFEL